VSAKRYLLVVADDYGIGPATSQGILELARRREITGAVLLVNSPYAEVAVHAWRQAGQPMELGWHPCLTLDRPVLPPAQVPTLVRPDGTFWPLGSFLRRLAWGMVNAADIERELWAQLQRFEELVGHPPRVLNAHHHVQVFPPIGAILIRLIEEHRPRPYVRRIREPWWMLARIPGARAKRAVLSTLGKRNARAQSAAGLPGNDWLVGITNPSCVADPQFLVRWLSHVPGKVVELTCHPGHFDGSLVGRDCTEDDGQLYRRPREFELLRQPAFRETCQRARFTLVAPSELISLQTRQLSHAA